MGSRIPPHRMQCRPASTSCNGSCSPYALSAIDARRLVRRAARMLSLSLITRFRLAVRFLLLALRRLGPRLCLLTRLLCGLGLRPRLLTRLLRALGLRPRLPTRWLCGLGLRRCLLTRWLRGLGLRPFLLTRWLRGPGLWFGLPRSRRLLVRRAQQPPIHGFARLVTVIALLQRPLLICIRVAIARILPLIDRQRSTGRRTSPIPLVPIAVLLLPAGTPMLTPTRRLSAVPLPKIAGWPAIIENRYTQHEIGY